MERGATFKTVVVKEGGEEEFFDLRDQRHSILPSNSWLRLNRSESLRPLTFESIKIPNDRVLFLERDFTEFTLIRGVCMFKSDTSALFIQCLNSFRKGRITGALESRGNSKRASEKGIERERLFRISIVDLDFWLINFFPFFFHLFLLLFLDEI